MFSTLCLSGFLSFLRTAFFVVGYISGTALFPEPLSGEEEKQALLKMKDGDEEARLSTYVSRCIDNLILM